jgi:hypothetical protein
MLVAAPFLAFAAARAPDERQDRVGGRSAVRFDPRAAARFALAFVLVAAGWWWHQWRAVGIPGFNLTSYTVIGFTARFPEVSVMRDFALTPAHWPGTLRAAWPALPGKWIAFFPHAVKHTLESPALSLSWLAAIGFFAALAAPPTRGFALLAAGLVLLPVAMMTATEYQRLYAVPYAGLIALGVAAGARTLFSFLPPWAHRPRAWIGALALAMIPSSAPALTEAGREARALQRWLAHDRAALAASAALPANRLMFSDTPDFVAWTTGRATVWVTKPEFDRLYPEDGRTPAERPAGLPSRPEALDVWFHADDHDPAKNAGPGP